MQQELKAPIGKYILVSLVFIQAISAIGGAINLLFNPFANSSMEQPLSTLNETPFKSFLIPGLILLVLLGIFPSFLIYPLIKKPAWKRVNIINIYQTMHWSWTYSLYLGIMLIVWINIQIFFIGYGSILQTIYSFVGLLIIVSALLPKVIKYYTL